MTAKSSSNSKQEEYKVELWPISKIKRDPNQPRKIFKQEAIQELAESIKQFGVLKNIEITKDGIIVTGENRWRAAKVAGLKEIPVRVIEVGDGKLLRQLHENIHHIPMQPGDVMRAVDTYRKQGLSLRAIAKKTGKSLSWVQNYAWLFELPTPLREAFEKGASDISTMRFFAPMALAEKEGVIEQ
jgi:ParB family chromosome partitioning protein